MADGPDRKSSMTLRLVNGEEILLIRVLSNEALSQHFTITLDVFVPWREDNPVNSVDFLPNMGKPAAVHVLDDGGDDRYFHGILVDAEYIQFVKGRGAQYRLTLRPKAFLHAQGSNLRIFQDMTTRQIIEKVLFECGIDFECGRMTNLDTPRRAYCVQYNESDFSFVSRLMEEDGLYYFYKHTDDKHILMVCDAPGSHKKGAFSPLAYSPGVGELDAKAGQYVHAWSERVSSGAERRTTLRDFDFMMPNTLLESKFPGGRQHDEDEIEIYSYPARSYEKSVGTRRGEAILDARRAGRQTYTGHSMCVALACGAKFELNKFISDRQNRGYLITHVHHQIASENYASTFGFAGGTEIEFEAIPDDVPWRAPLTTRRPIVSGPETAWVTGSNEEPEDQEGIYTDQYGRVKVQFHWDREGQRNENSSCWVRVSQTGGLGNVILPRVGHEVLVDFIDGDPDRPVVVGRLFNQSHMPVYSLPDHKTRAIWRSKSYKRVVPCDSAKEVKNEGSAFPPKLDDPGANEIRLEDATGAEELYFFAQRDLKSFTRHDEKHFLGNDQEIDVGNDRKLTVGKDETVHIIKNRTTNVDEIEKVEVGKQRTVKIGLTDLLDVTDKLTVKSGTQIEITAEDKITLKVGDSSIVMDDSSIEIKSGTIKTTATSMAEHKGGASKATLDASGVEIKGTVIRLN